MHNHGIVLFDGACNLCSHSVQFILKRDKKDHFRFASLQSECGRMLTQQYGLDSRIDSVIYINKGKAYIESSAAIQIGSRLGRSWPLVKTAKFIPSPIRDRLYRFIAAHRYEWFGHADSCMLPTPQNQAKFLTGSCK